MRMNRKKKCGKHAVISGIRMPQLRCTRVSESGILRRVALALCACLLFTTVFVGCGTEASDEPVDPNKLQVMASFYTMHDFAQKIGGEHVQVTCMGAVRHRAPRLGAVHKGYYPDGAGGRFYL